MSTETDAYDTFGDANLGLDLLRAEITADGGFDGLFERLRQADESVTALLGKYGRLLQTAVTEAQREVNRASIQETGEGWEIREHERIQNEMSLDPLDAAAHLTALVIHRAGFPEEYKKS